jgi:hypothetical protein
MGRGLAWAAPDGAARLGRFLGKLGHGRFRGFPRCHLCTGPGHIAFYVSDIDRSSTFFRDTLGISLIIDQVQDTKTVGLLHVYQHAR